MTRQKETEIIDLGVVIPVFEDQESFVRLLQDVSRAIEAGSNRLHATVYAVDDGSPSPLKVEAREIPSNLNLAIERLHQNSGHQKAIFRGLELAKQAEHTHFAVMDADGEDDAWSLPQMIKKSRNCRNAVVVAQRGTRKRKTSFIMMYRLHRLAFRILTGKTLDFGNFMLVPRSRLERLLGGRAAQTHLAATVLKSGLTICKVPSPRPARFQGQSKMNLESLLSHSVAALSVFADTILVRVFLFSAASGALVLVGLIGVVLIRLSWDQVEPGWATSAVGFMLLALLQLVSILLLVTLFWVGLKKIDSGQLAGRPLKE